MMHMVFPRFAINKTIIQIYYYNYKLTKKRLENVIDEFLKNSCIGKHKRHHQILEKAQFGLQSSDPVIAIFVSGQKWLQPLTLYICHSNMLSTIQCLSKETLWYRTQDRLVWITSLWGLIVSLCKIKVASKFPSPASSSCISNTWSEIFLSSSFILIGFNRLMEKQMYASRYVTCKLILFQYFSCPFSQIPSTYYKVHDQ